MGFFSSGVVPPLLVLLGLFGAAASPSPPPPEMLHGSYAGKSEFRTVNRKELQSCLNPSPYLTINVSTGGAPLPDEALLEVTVAGVLRPDASDWVAMITPSNSRCLYHYHRFNPIVVGRSHREVH
jgi:acid phosphatase type 7